MTIAEYHSWIAFYAEEPFGDVRGDLRAGIVASLIARTMGGRSNAKPMDYMPVVDARRRADEQEALEASQDNQTRMMRAAFESNLGPLTLRRSTITRH